MHSMHGPQRQEQQQQRQLQQQQQRVSSHAMNHAKQGHTALERELVDVPCE